MSTLHLNESGKIFLSTDSQLYAIDCYHCHELFTELEQFLDHFKEKHKTEDSREPIANDLVSIAFEEIETINSSDTLAKLQPNEEQFLDIEYILEEPEDIQETTNLETSTKMLTKHNGEQRRAKQKSSEILTFENSTSRTMRFFIDALRNFECLWNIHSVDYKKKTQCHLALTALSDLLNIEIETVQNSINYLSNWYKDRHQHSPSSSSHSDKEEIIELCSFLQPRLKHGIFKCSICYKTFSHKKHFDAHSQRHKDQLQFQCYMCPKRAATAAEITIHLRVHTGEKPYKCRHCGETFKTSSSACVHERKHGEPTIQCSFCTKAFYTNTQLKNHLNIHLNVRNYKCSDCSKTFTTAKALYSHKSNMHKKVKKC